MAILTDGVAVEAATRPTLELAARATGLPLGELDLLLGEDRARPLSPCRTRQLKAIGEARQRWKAKRVQRRGKYPGYIE